MDAKKPIVMIADSNEDLIWLYERWIRQEGCHVKIAKSGDWVLAQMVPEPPDLVLLNLSIEGLNGLEVCRQLKQADSFAPLKVIGVADFLDFGMQQQAILAGADVVLVKPISRTELTTHLCKLLNLEAAGELEDQIQDLERKVWASTSG
ncbi:MAG: response regulator [Deltaproteobacteria bacterium]|nr:response regulator [Deltaproteobacteria bacterium]